MVILGALINALLIIVGALVGRIFKNIPEDSFHAVPIVCSGFKKILQSGGSVSLLPLMKVIPKVLPNCRHIRC